MAEQLVALSDGTELCVEGFGDPDDPVLLLVHGAAASMDYWDTEFCERLAAHGLRVLRYDHRDTGRSTSWPAGEPGYTADDLDADVVRLLDALGIERAHLAGMSMGGGAAQTVAVTHPGRVLSLALLGTSPFLAGGPAPGELPPPAEKVRAAFDDPPPTPDWTDREAVAAWMLAAERAFAGDIVDEARSLALVERVIDRARDIAAMQTNHWVVVGAGSEPPGSFADITVPVLVVHGTADPLFPPAHGEALAAAVPGATLLLVEGMGHESPPPPTWDEVIPALVANTRRQAGQRG